MKLCRIRYNDLNAKQKENYNYQKISGTLAEYGFVTIRLNDDWDNADFLARHVNKELIIKVQLKSRIVFSKKYLGKKLYIAFRHPKHGSYLFPHDDLLRVFLQQTNMGNTKSWKKHGVYSFAGLSRKNRALLSDYKVQVREHSIRPEEN